MKKLFLTLTFLLIFLGVFAQTYTPVTIYPQFMQGKAYRALNYWDTPSPDSIIVISPNRWLGRYSLNNLVKTGVAYNNPSWINTLDYQKLINSPEFSEVALSGDYNDLLNLPNIPTNNNELVNGAGYLTSFTEVDPNVPSYSKSLTAFSVIKSSTDPLYKPIGYAPSSSEVITALGYTPYNGSTNPNGYINRSGISAGSGISYNSTTGVVSNSSPDQIVTLTAGNRISITGTYPNFTISYIEPIINIVSRTLNSNFTIGNKQANVSYSITCTVTNPLLAGSSTASVFLEYSTNSGTTWVNPSQNGNSSGVGLAVAIAITNGQTVTVSGSIPANALVRLRSTTTGTASVTYVTGTEIL